MSSDRRKVLKSIEKKGFTRVREGKHIILKFFLDGEPTLIRTLLSHGTNHRTVSSGLLSQMARQCKLNSKQFKDLIECSLTKQEYEFIVRNLTKTES